MTRLFVVTRDGRAYKTLLTKLGLTDRDIGRIKSPKNIPNQSNLKYIIIKPYPPTFLWNIKPRLDALGWVNVTKKFNKLQ